MKTLTPTQIEQLFDFVKSKYVRYYDVQLELVDHLASAIEQEMDGHSFLTFEQALNRVYGRWPITGFAQFIEEKRTGLRKYWRRRFWTYMRQYFQLPKIILTILLSGFFYGATLTSISILNTEINLLYIVLFIVCIKGYYDVHNPIIPHPSYGKEGLLTYEIFFEQIAWMLGPIAFLFYSLIQSPQGLSKAIVDNIYLGAGFSLLLAFSVIVLYAKGTVFKKWVADDILAKYPNFNVALLTNKL